MKKRAWAEIAGGGIVLAGSAALLARGSRSCGPVLRLRLVVPRPGPGRGERPADGHFAPEFGGAGLRLDGARLDPRLARLRGLQRPPGNWSYHELPPSLAVRWLGYAVAFATVIPALRSWPLSSGPS